METNCCTNRLIIILISQLCVCMLPSLTTHRMKDAQYDSHKRSNHNRHQATHKNASFSNPGHQMVAGTGGFVLFAMGKGRVAILVVWRYILLLAKQSERVFLNAALPEVGYGLAGKKGHSGKISIKTPRLPPRKQ